MKQWVLKGDGDDVYVGRYDEVLSYVKDNAQSLRAFSDLRMTSEVTTLPDNARVSDLRTLVAPTPPHRMSITFGKRVPVAHTLTRR